MDGIYNSRGGRFPSKKALREAIGQVVGIEVTAFGREGVTAAPGRYAIVGPHPYDRRWYATVDVDAGGILRKVDGKGAPRAKSSAPAAPAPVSCRVEVFVEGEWAGNALRFATLEEAKTYGRDLLSRWMLPTDYRVVTSADPVTEKSGAGQ